MTEIRHVHSRHHAVAAIMCLTLVAWLIFAFVGGAVFAAAGGNSGGNGNGVANGSANGSGNGNGVGNAVGAANAPGQLKKQDPVVPVVVDPSTAPVAAGAVSPAAASPAGQHSGGANNGGDCGAYCSTQDGSPALNGNGKGKAVGKPCAGCVGKADNKNPPGQRPNGSDPNKGYECDANHGIGKSNPAHSSCKPKSPPDCHQLGTCPPPPDCHQLGTCPPPPDCQALGTCPPPPDCQALGTCPPPPDCHQLGTCPPPPKCLPSEDNNFCSPVEAHHHTKHGPPVKVLGEKVVRTIPPPSSELPFTGADLAPLLGIATLAMAAGSWLMLSGGQARRRATTGRP